MRLTGRLSSVVLVSGLLAATPSAAQRGPAPAAAHLDANVIGLACAPSVVYEMPLADLRVTGGQDSFVRRIFIPGDLITIKAKRIILVDDKVVEVRHQPIRLPKSLGIPTVRVVCNRQPQHTHFRAQP